MTKKRINGIKYWAQVFMLPIYWFSFITPRSRKIWLFGSTFGKRFADNARYFYLYVNQYQKQTARAIWITHDKKIVDLLSAHKMEVYHYKSLRGIYYCLRGYVYIFDNYSKDISFWLSGGAVKVNLWHGSGNKKTNYDNKFDWVRHPRNNWERFKTALRRMSDEKPHHYTLATSPMMAEIFTSAFHTDLAHIIQEGYPRNDVLFSNGLINIYTGEEQKILEYIKQKKGEGKKLILYMPTFRDSESLFFRVMDLERFNRYLTQKDLIFFTKLHPKSKVKDKFHQVEYTNIINIDSEVDPYTILMYTDLLVTDYSSIYSDYLMLNRPSVLFPYDYEEYSKDTRECYFEYNDYMPEIKAYTMDQLMEYIDLVLQEDSYEEGRMKLRDRIFASADGNSSTRLYEKIGMIINR
jgi:CDP-glycerol glycerophosphotransferase (TagB/SpsB family)